MVANRYPGRDRVLSRDDARDYLWRQSLEAGTVHPCEAPVIIHGIGLPSFLDPGGKPLPVEMQARCRKCAECLAHRRRLWTARAVDEISVSERTWFGTLTVAPEHRLRIQWSAEQKRLRCGGESLSSLTAPDQYRYLANELGKEVTKYLKRLRKNGPLRYFAVFEAHKDGFPHVHLLIHEQQYMHRKRDLQDQWRIGFSHFKLTDREPAAAVYVAKYLAKDALTRVRASQSYGQRHKVALYAERLQDVTRSVEQSERSGERERSEWSVGGAERP